MLSVATGLSETEALARAALLDVGSYEVFLDLTAGPARARSHTEIRFACRVPGADSFADLTAPMVHGVVLNDEPLDPAAAISGGRLHLPALAASNTLTVDAEFPYSGDACGLTYFTDPADGAAYVFANCFPTYAPRVFCCFDQADLRADISLSVSAPAGWDCVANGAVVERPADGAAGVWRFATVPAMKTYELTICAGAYVTVVTADQAASPVKLTVRCRRSLASSPGLARVAETVGTVIGFYAEFLSVPCPYERVDIAFAPELGPTAMQLPAVTLVNETLLDRLAGADHEFVTVVLAHEVAHLWFGCLVEGRWWDDLWLAETMATYLSYVACDQALGLPAPWAEFAMRDQAAAYRADSLPSAEPVSSPVATAADALTRPAALTYNKGASVIRQLAALIGDDALRTGMRDYLTGYGGSAATLADLLGCWSDASGRDLSGWAAQWLQQPGVNTLRPELTIGPDGAIESLVVLQDPPTAPESGQLRTHKIAIGAYDLNEGTLRRRLLTSAEIDGARTVVPQFAGAPAPDAIILNDGDLTFAKVRFDDRSFRTLAECAFSLDDPLTEAVCWNAAWDMTMTADLSAAGFVQLVAGRIRSGQPIAGLAELLAHAVAAADLYCPPRQRSRLRQQVAAAARAGVEVSRPGSATQRALAVGFAASACGHDQLGTLRSWLDGRPALSSGVRIDAELRARILQTLAVSGLATDADLDAYARADPVSGETVRATCKALRPDRAAKDAAWTAALAVGQLPRLALAHAQGIWVPGQDDILREFRDRYFAQALAALPGINQRTALRLARLLYPATLAEEATLRATDAAVSGGDLAGPFRRALLEQRTILAQMLAARQAVLAQGQLQADQRARNSQNGRAQARENDVLPE
jgi:aminopeptidase N